MTSWFPVKLNFIAKNQMVEYFIPALQYSMYILLTQYGLLKIYTTRLGRTKTKHVITSKTKKKYDAKKINFVFREPHRATHSCAVTFAALAVCALCIVHPNFKSKYSVVIWKSIQLYVTHRLLQQRFWKWKSYWKVL